MKIKILNVIKSKGFLIGLSSGVSIFLVFVGLFLFLQVKSGQDTSNQMQPAVTETIQQTSSPTPTSSSTTKTETRKTTKPVLGATSSTSSSPAPTPQNQQPTNNAPTQIIVVVPTNTPTPAPIVVQDNSWKVEWCENSIANFEASKQESINSAITSAQTECGKRGYSAPNYEGCESYIQARVDDVTGYWDGVILNFKLSNGCV